MSDKPKMTEPTCNDKAMSKEAIPMRKQIAMGKNPQTGCGKGDKGKK